MRHPPASVLVWATFAASAVGAILFMHTFASRIPVIDDYFYLDLWLDSRWPGVGQLWQPLNEHRLPLPKFVTWLTARLGGVNLKHQIGVNLAMLIGVTAYLLNCVRHYRTETRLSDCFLPLVILSVGHAESLLWAVQVNFYVPIVLSLVILGRLLRLGPTLTLADEVVVGLCLMGLALSGVQGIVMAVPLAGWLVLIATFTPTAWPTRMIGLMFATGTLGVAALAFFGPSPGATVTPPPHLDAQAVRYMVRSLGGGWGPAGERITPSEPTIWPTLLGVMTTLLTLVTAGIIMSVGLQSARHRTAALGLIAFAVGYGLLAVGLGTGRAALTDGVLANRYMTLMIPLVVWLAISWVWLAPMMPRTSQILQPILAAMALGFAWPNAECGFVIARHAAVHQSLFERDIRLGVPSVFLDAHHHPHLFPTSPGIVAPRLERLRLAGVKPFDRIAPPMELHPQPLAWEAVGVAPASDDNSVTADRTELIQYTLRFREATITPAIQVNYELAGPSVRIDSEAHWQRAVPDIPALDCMVRKPLNVGKNSRQLWVGTGVQEVKLLVRGPARLVIHEVLALQ